MTGLLLRFLPHIIILLVISAGVWAVKNHFDEFERLEVAEQTLTKDLEDMTNDYDVEQDNHLQTKVNFKEYQSNVNRSFESMRSDLNNVRLEFNRSEERADELSKKLGRHNLSHLAAEKPGLISRRATAATARLFTELNETTGQAAARGDDGGSPEDAVSVPTAIRPETEASNVGSDQQ